MTYLLAAAVCLLPLADPALAQTPADWCDCMRYKRSSFETQPWTSQRAGRCTRFTASNREACRAQGKGDVLDWDAKEKKK